MKDYLPRNWQTLLAADGLDNFDALWSLDIGWYEPRNERRGGWSGVSRCELESRQGEHVGIFIKRQENHVSRTWAHPVRGIPTFRREFRNLLRYRTCGVPTLEPVYYAERRVDGSRRAILITRELAGYTSLQHCQENWSAQGRPAAPLRRDMLRRLAAVVCRLHRQRLQHNCLYPKHVFIGGSDDNVDVRLIDLEKTKRRLSRARAMLRDLDTLNRRSTGWSRTDRLRFLLAYLGQERVNVRVRRAWKKLVARAASKVTD